MADPFKDLFDQVSDEVEREFAQFPADNTASYLARPVTKDTLRDPAFLADLRDYYTQRGMSTGYMTDEELIDAFYSDRNWADLNTVSAAKDAYRAVTADQDQRALARNIQQVWQGLPNMFAEGGRGISALPDVAGALIADPINLIGGAAAKPAAAGAARAATLAGKNAMKEGLKAGVKRAAVTEGLLGAGAEAGFDAITQSRDINLGLQDDYSLAQTGMAAALGGTLSGAMGAVVGALPAWSGSKEGMEVVEAMRRVGIKDDEIGRISNQQAQRIISDPDYFGEFLTTYQEGIRKEAAADTAELTAPLEGDIDADIEASAGEVTKRWELFLRRLRRNLDEAHAEELPAEEIEELEALVNRAASLRSFSARMEREAREIIALESSSAEAAQAQAKRRREEFERDYSTFRRVLGAGPDFEQAVKALELRAAQRGEVDRAAAKPKTKETQTADAQPTPDTETQAPRETPTEGAEPQDTPDQEAEAATDEAVKRPAYTATTPARSFAKEQGVNLADVVPKDGKRINKADVQAHLKTKQTEAEIAQGTADMRKAMGMSEEPDIADAGDGYITEEAGELAKKWGVDVGSIKGTGPNGQITSQDVGEAFAARADNGVDTPDGPVAADAPMREAPDLRIAGRTSDHITDITERREVMNQGAEIIRAANKANFRSGDNMAAFVDAMLKTDTYAPRAAALREYLQPLMDLPEIDADQLTKRQLDEARKLARVYREGGAVPEYLVDRIARAQAIARSGGKVPSRSLVPSNAARVEEAGLPSNRRQGSIPIAKGAAHTIVPSYDLKYPMKSGLGAELAMTLSKQDNKVFPFLASGQERDVIGHRGRGKYGVSNQIAKGQVLYADAKTGQVFASPRAIEAWRNDGVPAVIHDYVLDTNAVVRSGDPEGGVTNITQLTMDDALARSKGVRRKAAQQAAREAVESPPPSTPSIKDDGTDFRYVVRLKEDPTVLRLGGPNQTLEGSTLLKYRGKEKAPELWDVRTVPASAVKRGDGRNPARLERLFAEGDPLDGMAPDAEAPTRSPEDAQQIEEMVASVKANDETPASSFETVKNRSTDLSETEASGLARARKLLADPYVKEGSVVRLGDMVELERALFSADWDTLPLDDRLAALEAVYKVKTRLAPEGVALPNNTRKAAIENLDRLMSRYSAEERKEASDLLTRLATEEDIGPIFAEIKAGGSRNMFDQADNAQVVGLDLESPRRDLAMNRMTPRLHDVYREVATWAFHNVLSDQDRLDYMRLARRYDHSDPKTMASRLDMRGHMDGVNTSPMDLFGNNFVMFATGDGSMLRDLSYWQRVTEKIKGIYDRFVNRRRIEPKLIPLFKKILPEEVITETRLAKLDAEVAKKQVRPSFVKKAATPAEISSSASGAEVYTNAMWQLEYLHQGMVDALENGSDDEIANQARALADWLGAAEGSKTTKGLKALGSSRKHNRKSLKPAMRQRREYINEALSGNLEGTEAEVAGNVARMSAEGANIVLPDPEAAAKKIRHGWTAPLYGDNPYSSIRATIGMVYNELENARSRAMRKAGMALDDPNFNVPPRPAAADYTLTLGKRSTPKEEPSARSKRGQRVLRSAKTEMAGMDKEALTALSREAGAKAKGAGKDKALRRNDTSTWNAVNLQQYTLRTLKDLFKKTEEGTPERMTVSAALVAKERTIPVEPKHVERIRPSIREMNDADLNVAFLNAVSDGEDPSLLDELISELRDRGADVRNRIAPREPRVINAIRQEETDFAGVMDNLGIPPNARDTIRELLSYFVHRDPEVQLAMRRMLYRALNLLGRTAMEATGDLNIVSALDLNRLANNGLKGDAVFYNPKGVEVRDARKRFRNMALGLTKGEANPLDVIHEIGHMVISGGLLPEDELNAVYRAWENANDEIKATVIKGYGPRTANMSAAQADAYLAEEWFAEQFAKYMAERIGRSGIYDQLAQNALQDVTLKSGLERAIDRLVEYVSYLVNGMIGRQDIRQTFRRMTLFGDMMERQMEHPFGRASDQVSFPARLAPTMAADRFASSPRIQASLIRDFISDGVGWDKAKGQPNVYYHGTPRGDKLERAANPNAILLPSRAGHYGRGIYVSDIPEPAGEVYAQRPTPESMRRQLADLHPTWSNEKLDDAMAFADDLSEVRQRLSVAREAYTWIMDDMAEADDINFPALADELNDTAEVIDELLFEEAMMTREAERLGIVIEPMVLPLYIRLTNPADFRMSTMYGAEDPFIVSIFDGIGQKYPELAQPMASARARMAELQGKGEAFGGARVYKHAVDAITKTGMNRDTAQGIFTDWLQDAGYDGMLTTHINMISAGGEEAAPGMSYAGMRQDYTAPVLFSSKQVKHVNASNFDHSSAELYNRVPPEVNLARIGEMLADEPSEVSPGLLGEYMAANDVHSRVRSLFMTRERGRPHNAVEAQTIEDMSVTRYFWRQSDTIRQMGMKFLGDWYQRHFADVHQRFGGKFMPILQALGDLPDSPGWFRNWINRSTAGLTEKTPESHLKIRQAILKGKSSRAYLKLTKGEREVADMIVNTLRGELNELRKAGIFVGDRGDTYLPQVWEAAKIRKNKGEFLTAMVEYYRIEKEAGGQPFKVSEAREFAERMFDRLGDEESDGIFLPIDGSSRTPGFDSADHQLMIELDKYPQAREALEPFIQKDLNTLLVKYLEGSSRRLIHVQKWGINNHGLYDYLLVADQGRKGIARLLSTNKVFNRAIKIKTDEAVEEATLRNVVRMPFGDEFKAAGFVDELVETHQKNGREAARKALMDIAPRSVSGAIPPAYQRRVDAIIGALDDFKGEVSPMKNTDLRFIENAMLVSMKKQQMGVSNQLHRASQTIRSINSITLLGYTALTSIPDLALPLIRSGNMKAFIRGLSKTFATDPDYRRMIARTGVAIENIMHDRLIHQYGAADAKGTNAFFNATLLTPWTDVMRKMGGAVGYESFQSMQASAQRHFKPGLPMEEQPRKYRIADRYLRRYGLGDFLPGQPRASESLSNVDLVETDRALRMAINQFADESIFTPNADDMPLWTLTPVGAIIAQLKSFPLMMQRMAKDVLVEAGKGNPMPLLYLASAGPLMGAAGMSAKDILQMRGGEDNREAALRTRNLAQFAGYSEDGFGSEDDFWGWYLEGMMMAGGFGLIADILHGVATQAENGAYGEVRIMSLIFGPSVGLATSSIRMGAGLMDSNEDSNAKERVGVREAVTRIPLVGGNRAAREGIVDWIAGEAEG